MAKKKNAPQFNLRAQEYWIYETTVPCYSCKRESRAVAILLPENFEERDETTGHWLPQEGRLILHSVEEMSPDLTYQLTFINPFYSLDRDSIAPDKIFLNHCEFCHAKFEEDYLYGGNSLLFPMEDQEKLDKGLLRQVLAPFDCRANYTMGEDDWIGTRIAVIKIRA